MKKNAAPVKKLEDNFIVRDERFYTYDDVGDLPRVTFILSSWPKDDGFFLWMKQNGQQSDDIRDAAAESGTLVHELCGQLMEGKILTFDDNLCTVKEWEKVISFAAWFRTFKPDKILAIEKHTRSVKHGYAGTADIIAIKDKKVYLLDIKSGKSVYPSHWAQVSSYAKSIVDEKFVKRVHFLGIIHVGTKHTVGYNFLVEKNEAKHFASFKKCQAMFELQYPSLRSNHKSYPLTLQLTMS